MRYQIVRATILIRVEVILSEHVEDEICMSVSSLLGGKARPESHRLGVIWSFPLRPYLISIIFVHLHILRPENFTLKGA